MAASWQDHIHILTAAPDADEATGEWSVMAKGLKPTGMPEHSVIAVPRRALDGTLRAHVLQSAGTPVLLTDYTLMVKCDAITDVSTWSGYLGTTKYFVPAYHDAAAHDDYDVLVLVEKIGVPESPGPLAPVFYLPVRLTDAD